MTEKAETHINGLTATLFEEGLNSIGWSLRDCGCGLKQVYDNKQRGVPMILNSSGTELRMDRHDDNWAFNVTLENCAFRAHGDTCLTLGASDDWKGNTLFLQFHRFD